MQATPIATTRSDVVVGISDLKVSSTLTDTLITHSLGSCVGLTLFDPASRIGGMLHAMLPMSKISSEKAADNPYMFVDTGVIALIDAMLDAGAESRRLVARVAGAAKLLNDNDSFNIGSRNHTVLKKVLWKNNIMIAAEDVGGSSARTMSLSISTGETTLRSGNRVWKLE